MMDETIQRRSADPFSQANLDGASPPKLGMEFLIGSNIFRNTNGVVKIHGKEQLVLEYKPERGLLLLTIDLYGEAGNHIAHLRRNALALNQDGRFAIEVHQAAPDVPGDVPSVRLRDQQSGALVFEASTLSDQKIHITIGKFFSHKGLPVEITPHYCRIGSGMTLFGDIVDSRGGMVVLG